MRVALIFPPQGHFTQPYLSLPSLAAYLRANGVEDVTPIDANIEAYDEFLSEARVRRALERVDAVAELARLEAEPELRYSQLERYQTLSEIALIGEQVAARVEEAKGVLRSREEFYDYERYLWAGRTVEQALRIVSAEFWPTRLTAHNLAMRHRIESSAEIVAALGDEAENPYVEWFRESLMPRLRELDPDLVGISVTFGSQAIPSLTLAKQLKAWKPELHVTMGGGLLAYVAEKLAKRDEVWDLIDSFVMLEGERPLLQLCETLDGDGDLSKVTNLIYRDASGTVVHTERQEPLDIKTLPTPDFDGMPLEKYLSPELVMPLAATRGCYWGKCVFCTLYTVIGPGYRGRTLDQTVEDMRVLQEKYGANSFYLAIEDLPPNMAKALPRKILDAGLDVTWWCDARLEHDVFDEQVCRDLAASGCRRIAFGYESASRRVLDSMCKGIDPDASLDLIRRVHEAGISVTLYVMIGFPTETLEEARLTLDTVMAHRDWIQEVSVRVFYLDETSEVFRRRAEFDITEIHPDPTADLQVYYDFTASSGMSRREARDLYLEFTQQLRSHFPVFQSTNMLYHELKGHYFLYLNHFGGWDRLRREVLEAPAARAAAPAAAAPRPRRLVRRALAYDRGEIDAFLTHVDTRTLRPRYQSDLIDAADQRRFDQELPAISPAPSELVYDAHSGEVHCVSPAAAELLGRCDGTRTLEQVVEVVPAPHRADALRCLHDMAGAGLLESAAPRNEEPTP